MRQQLQITAVGADPALLDLPWDVPLEDWPADQLAALPRGISRHVVRFARLSGRVVAVKEIGAELARREYGLLRLLRRLDVPCVEPVGIVSGRQAADGTPLDPALVTRHLEFSLPYRALFSQALRPDTAQRLVDALAVLLVRLHLSGFFWGDVSLSNTLFRRDAGAFAAYLVDAETGELHGQLSDRMREYDVEVGCENVFAELLDVQEAQPELAGQVDPFAVIERVKDRYGSLWHELTAVEQFGVDEIWRIEQRVERLGELGFDVEELAMDSDPSGATVSIQPRVVEAGHHARELEELTGLEVEDNQARRLLADLSSYMAHHGLTDRVSAARRWRSEIYDAITASVPPELRGRLEPAEVFHQILEHRWLLSERAGREIGIFETTRDYLDHVLARLPEEKLTAPD